MSRAPDISAQQVRSGGTEPGCAPIGWARAGFQAAVLAILVAALYWHVLYVLVYKWTNVGDWSHGFLIPVFSLYYLYNQRHRLPAATVRPGYPGLAVVFLGFALYLLGVYGRMDYFKSLSLLVTIFGVIYVVCGWPVARWSWFAVAFLFFALPLPQRLYEQITMPLQQIASAVSALLLNLLPGMDAEAENIVVSYLYKGVEGELNVEQACSGIRLMMAFVALGVAMAFVAERPLWHRMVMVLSCIPIAIFCNVVRVTTTGLFIVFGRPDLARGSYHAMLGLSMLVVAFGLFGLISYILGNLFVEVHGDGDAAGRDREGANA